MPTTLSLPPALHRFPAVRVLAEAVQRDRLAHAILIFGEDMAVLETVALALSRTLLRCEDATAHPDFHTLRPAKKLRFIRIGENSDEENTMRRLLRLLHQTASRGDRKVAVIYEADRMNTAAANAFLKTLEEPPAGTTMLLLSTRPYDLLATIRSRCFRFRLPGQLEAAELPAWHQWLTDYQAWLGILLQKPVDKAAVADRVLALYGLIARFHGLLEEQFAAIWTEEKKRITMELDDEEWDALETGVRKGLRSRLFLSIEQATRDFALDMARLGQPYPSQPLTQAVSELERVHGLLEVNLREEAALEHFFLFCLRTWTPRT